MSRQIDFVVGDAESPPVRRGAFHACLFLGALHHFPEPADAVRTASTCLRAGGHFYSQDPHKSPVRFLFDGLMRIWKLYDEEARVDPLLDAEQLVSWMSAAGITGDTRVSVYLPPHLFRLLNSPSAGVILRTTDAFCGAIPGIRKWGGFIIATGRKVMSV
jgi:SAM-dependent methyltransferase